ncbi:MAG: alpha/beta hydrolase [Hyphomicrobiaceae bacterium]|nr:alpha/beta hydrolase [Hyphomicrobiaceae bacterium]
MELVALARNPVPSGAVVGAFEGYDGGPMRFARWQPTRGPRRGTVCVFTGRSEFIEKYFEVIADLRRRGFDVAIMDWRGQGGSYRPLRNPRKGWVRTFSEYDKDLACFMQQVVLPSCPAPHIALAHSMGGHILLRNAGQPSCRFERMVLLAPMLRFHDSKVGTPQRLASLYATVGTALGLGRAYVRGGSDASADPVAFEGNPLTSDRDRFARNRALIDAAPHLLLGAPTIGWLNAAYRSMAMLSSPAYAERLQVPLLIGIAGQDTIVDSRATEAFAARLKVGTTLMLSLARHEILQESDEIRARFWAAFDAYLGVEQVA